MQDLTEADEQVTKQPEVKIKRYCTTCQKPQDPEGGERRPNRWICAACVYRRKHRINTWKKVKQ